MKREISLMIVTSLIFIVYSTIVVYAQNAYPGYDRRFDKLEGGIQIQVFKAEWYGASLTNWLCSLAFPVYFSDYPWQNVPGFITAGHCIHTDWGGDYVYQPNLTNWLTPKYNYIGRGIRSTWPFTGNEVTTDLDAALIRLADITRFGPVKTRDFKPFIFENGTYYYIGQYRDANNEVGIFTYEDPTQNITHHLRKIAYKSGRTTGLTYGNITYIGPAEICAEVVNNRCARIVYLDPAIVISRCPNNQCYYNAPIAAGGDSGGIVYYRELISIEKIGNVIIAHYQAHVIGIVSATNGITLIAAVALRVLNRWPDISLPTCGYGSMCY